MKLAGILAVVLLGAAGPVAADTFKIASFACGGGVCQSSTPTGVCQAYAAARIAYSQSNPTDFNKWVSYSAMLVPPAVVPSPTSCVAIGNCQFVLRAQNGFQETQIAPIQQCPRPTDIVEVDRTQRDPPGGQPCFGNPILPVTGAKRESVSLGLAAGWLPLQITYDTTRRMPTTTPVDGEARTPWLSGFGDLWYGSLHRGMVIDYGAGAARVGRSNGRVISFRGDGRGGFEPEIGSNDRLIAAGNGYRFFDTDGRVIESYDSDGRLQRIDRIDGQFVAFAYSDSSTPADTAPGAGYLVGLTDAFGRETKFRYGTDGLVSAILGVDGRATVPGYFNGRLASILWPDNARRSFLYENQSLPWALTAIMDERLVRVSNFSYDAFGRAVATERAGRTNRFSVTYARPPWVVVSETFDPATGVAYRTRTWEPPEAPTVTLPNGSTTTLTMGTAAGLPVVTGRSQAAGSGCPASASSAAFDARGNKLIEDDFTGRRTCFAADGTRNLETIRVEGLASSATCSTLVIDGASLPSGSRRISTEWHPDWPLATRRAEPGLVTTFVYNGQPDPDARGAPASCAPATALLPDGKPIVVLCRQVEEATADVNGTAGIGVVPNPGVPRRVRSWTYNEVGQILTEADAAGSVTTLGYFEATSADATRGDLASETNARGHVLRFTRYNRHGRWIESIDPNGRVIRRTFDARQRLRTVDDAGQPTSFEFDAAGALSGVVRPDGTFTRYEYDAAHRLTAVVDSTGTRVDYTLDESGNRRVEQITGRPGTAWRSIGRAYDALGRLQRLDGRE